MAGSTGAIAVAGRQGPSKIRSSRSACWGCKRSVPSSTQISSSNSLVNVAGQRLGRMSFSGEDWRPAPPFSSAGKRSPSDARNSLVAVFAHLVARHRPQAFLFENVEGFLTGGDSGKWVVDLLDPLIAAGYCIHVPTRSSSTPRTGAGYSATTGFGTGGRWRKFGSARNLRLSASISRQVARKPCGAGGKSCSMALRSFGRL